MLPATTVGGTCVAAIRTILNKVMLTQIDVVYHIQYMGTIYVHVLSVSCALCL